MTARDQIFRKVSLERLSSPEQLDLLVQVITPRAWLAWLPLAGIVVATTLWGIFGSVSTVVSGRAILLQQGGLAEVSSAAQGRVLSIDVAVGDRVVKGQAVARIAQPELVERQRQALDRLAELQRQASRIKGLSEQGGHLNAASLEQQRATYQQQRQATAERMKLLNERIVAQNTLLDQGLITRQSLLNTQGELTAARLEIERLNGLIQQLSLKKLETRKQAESEQSQIEAQVAEARRTVEGLAETGRLTTRVDSPYSGRIVEVRVSPGALVSIGMPLVLVEPEGAASDELEAAVYLAAADGKKVAQGMGVQLAPATVRREEYGYLMGEVRFVSDYPATLQSMRVTLQNEELVKELSGSSAPIELRVKLQRADNGQGYRWSSPQGPPLRISAGTPAQADIVVRRQPPIALVIPALKHALGVY